MNEALLRVIHTLADGFGYLGSLAQAHANLALAVTYHYQRSEGEAATAFNNLCDTVDKYNLLFKTVIRLFTSVALIEISQCLVLLRLEFQAGFTRGFSQGSYAAVVQVTTTIEYNLGNAGS